MPSEAIALVRRFFELTAGDDPAPVVEVLHPDVVWLGAKGGLDEEQVLRGHDAVLEYLQEIREPWRHFEVELERFVEAGDTVVVLSREKAQSRQGGPEMHNDIASMFRVRNGKIVWMRGYLDQDEALKVLKAAK
jgi:ketosteroid isomerase-like protein